MRSGCVCPQHDDAAARRQPCAYPVELKCGIHPSILGSFNCNCISTTHRSGRAADLAQVGERVFTRSGNTSPPPRHLIVTTPCPSFALSAHLFFLHIRFFYGIPFLKMHSYSSWSAVCCSCPAIHWVLNAPPRPSRSYSFDFGVELSPFPPSFPSTLAPFLSFPSANQ